MKIQYIGAKFLLLALICFTSCHQETKSSKSIVPKLFFDTKAYFETELKRLESLNTKVLKRVQVGNEKSEQILDSIDFKRELGSFISSDINRPAWSDKYEVDSIWASNGELTKLTYRSLDSDLKTQFVCVSFKSNNVDEITFENTLPSIISNSRQKLTYNPNKGYSIESNQKVAMSKERLFKVEVVF